MSTNKHDVVRTAVRSALLLALAPVAAQAQSPAGESMEEIHVTGSRIRQSGAISQQPVFTLDRTAIERTGVANIGDVLQQMTTSGKGLNAKFNSSGNFGYPPDGGGIGAGSAQIDLRNLESKRVLVLVDGVRWVNESSASGVSGSADLNTIPLSIIERVEVLEDGASAIYGSDAIAGVINIITRKNFDGIEVNGYYGEYEEGGETTDASLTLGGSGERFSGMFVASYYEQKDISSGSWEQSAFPQPNAGIGAGSSGIPQGRFVFCDPSRPTGQAGSCASGDFYDVTLNSGTTTPVWDPANPTGGATTYHAFGGADRFNYAPFNLLLTPTERKSLYTSMLYEVTDDVEVHIKALYNNRTSTNQAAPEPMFVGPSAGTGGLADTISISAANPFNPFGIDLDAGSNLAVVTRRPIEVGPRIFDQDVDTWYVNVGAEGDLDFGRGYTWTVDLSTSENKADQTFQNGYNLAKMKLALGDPTVCAQVAGCTPLDLFGGQARPMTQEMIDYIRTTQIDSSEQTLDLITANITGDLFDIGDRAVAFAAGYEHRRYEGKFDPDPLRQTGESQDSFASPVSESYDVDEVYAEFNFPVLESLDVSAAARFSDYSTFGSETTGKVGFRWQPIDDLALRGTYSTGFRAPNLGELFGLTQFAATLTDPCGPTGTVIVDDADGPNTTPLETACRAQGVPSGFEQANTQIITFTGGNPELEPETSDSYTVGVVYGASWAEDLAGTEGLAFEVTYYHHEIEDAIQARDLPALLTDCLAAGGTDATLCSPFVRQASGNLSPPNNFLDNLGKIETDGVDFKANWASEPFSWGALTAALQTTYVNDYEAVDVDGIVSQRTVGIEVNNSAIPEWQANLQLGWTFGDFDAVWSIRYIDGVEEFCSNALTDGVPGCETFADMNKLDSTVYNDAQLAWSDPFALTGLRLTFGINNIFDEDPPICYSCSLNGYDAGTYDLPGRFWNVSARYRF